MPDKWLVTIAASKVTEATERLRRLGCRLPPDTAVPTDEDVVLQVWAPDGMERKIARVSGVKGVHPDSELTLY